MKTCLHAYLMCQSMFCAFPAPQVWDEKARDSMLLFFPAVGLLIGAVWAALAWLCAWLRLPALVTGMLLCAYPYLATGFIHLDGFMDVTDALRSWRDLERRREILKDSHVGSFAVIGVVLLLLAQFALFASAPAEASPWLLLLIPAVSRCCAALAVLGLRPMPGSQYAGHQGPRRRLWIPACLLAALLALGFVLCGQGGFALLACLLGFGLALRRGYRSLEGMNGDISGYALTIGELCAVAGYALL